MCRNWNILTTNSSYPVFARELGALKKVPVHSTLDPTVNCFMYEIFISPGERDQRQKRENDFHEAYDKLTLVCRN
ncbi:unnamed protein product, partial [Calicophoron daubneyi]